LILSNPPYGFISVTSDIEELFQSSDFDMPIRSGWVRGDLAFFLKAWDISQFGTNLGFIVASPLMRDRGYLKFRERLVKGMRHLSVTQLSNRTFENADVTAFLISGCRATNRRRNILLRKSLADGSIIDEMEISSEQAILSLDIDFHRAIQRIGVDVSLTDENIASIGIAIERGSKSLNDFRRLGIRAFHTTDFPENKNTVSSSVNQVQFKYASQGDILIPRVGSRCLAKQVRVKEGDVVFTDCIYRLTGNKKSLGKAWKTLNSTFGAEWRLANANGSCARFLTLDSILSMPIIA
jgi:hypothetical protein